MILSSTSPYALLNEFSGTIPIFTVFQIIYEHDCSFIIGKIHERLVKNGKKTTLILQSIYFNNINNSFLGC